MAEREALASLSSLEDLVLQQNSWSPCSDNLFPSLLPYSLSLSYERCVVDVLAGLGTMVIHSLPFNSF